MKKHFMIDIETTGLDPKKDEILQVSALELDHDGTFWVPGKLFNRFIPTTMGPKNDFALEKMGWLYKHCNSLYMEKDAYANMNPYSIREEIVSFFKSCGCENWNVLLMGKNATSFDVPFLLEHDYLKANNSAGTNLPDFHYRIYELQGAMSLVMDFLNWDDRDSLLELAKRSDSTITMPTDLHDHDARKDCYLQVKELNGLKKVLHYCSSQLLAKEIILNDLMTIRSEKAK